MKPATPSRLSLYAAPMRGRPKYAPLTAGLLARKGEAHPATAAFAAEAYEMFGPAALASAQAAESPAAPTQEPPPLRAQGFSLRRIPTPHGDEAPPAEGRPPAPRIVAGSAEAPHSEAGRAIVLVGPRVSLTLEIALEAFARLVIEAHRKDETAAELIAHVIERHVAERMPAS